MEETVHLQPRGIGELMDQALRLYRRNFFTFVGIVAVPQIPLTIISTFVNQLNPSLRAGRLSPSEQFEQMGPFYLGLLVMMLISFVLQGIGMAALTRAIGDNYLGGRTGFLEAYRKIGKDWSRLLMALFLSALINIALFIWLLVPCVGWISGFGMMMAFAIVMQFVPCAVVLEHKSASDAIRRGWDLCRRRFWSVIGFYALLTLFAQLITTAPAMIVAMIIQATSLSTALSSALAQGAITLISSLLYMPLSMTAMTLMYFDLRVRTEGFDLTWQTDHTLGEEMPAEDILARAPEAEQGGLMTKNDFGNMVLLSLGVVAIFMVIYGVIMALTLLFFGLLGLAQ